MNVLSGNRLFRRLKRSVAPGLRAFAGGRSSRPDTGARQADFEVARTRREVIELAWPIATAMLGDTAMGLVDTQLVGRLGSSALGGVGVGATIMWLGYAFVFGVMRGVKVRSAHALGEGRRRDAYRFAQAGVLIGLVLGVLMWLVSRDAGWMLRALRIDASLHEDARAFLSARTFGAPAVFTLSALVQSRQGVGDTRTPMYVGLFGNLVNLVLAWSLIYGHFGLPALGVRGAGFATAATECLQASVLAVIVIRAARASRSEDAHAPIARRAAFREVIRIGGPTGLHMLLEMTAFTTFTALLGGLGAEQVAAHQIAMAINRVSFLPGLAVAEAASVLVGRSLGRRSLREADRVVRASMQLAVGFMTACGVVFAVGAEAISRAFTNDHGVAEIVVRLLHVAAVFQTLDAVTTVYRSALRGAKDVRAVMIIGTSVVWTCVPTAAYVLGTRYGLGAVGGWYGFIAETTLSALIFAMRWKSDTWRTPYASLRSARRRGSRASTSMSAPAPAVAG